METTMTLTGYVGNSPELRTTKTGVSTVSFRVASTPRIHQDGQWTDGATTWVTVVAYRALADHICRSLGKGDPVVVHGRVRTQAWVDGRGQAHDKQVIEAATVGHDLSRGVTAFARTTPRAYDATPAADPEAVPEEETPEDGFEDAVDQAEELALAA